MEIRNGQDAAVVTRDTAVTQRCYHLIFILGTKGHALMDVRGTEADTAPPKHSMRVEWFQRDPGGTTLFVAPLPDGGAAPQPDADEIAATHR